MFNRTKPKTEQVAAVAGLAAVRQRMLDAAKPLDEGGRRITAIVGPAGEALQAAERTLAEARAANAEVIDAAAERADIRRWDCDARKAFAETFPAERLPVKAATLRLFQRRVDDAQVALLEAERQAQAILDAIAPEQAAYAVAAADYEATHRETLIDLAMTLVREQIAYRRAAFMRQQAVQALLEKLGGSAGPVNAFIRNERGYGRQEDERQASIAVRRLLDHLATTPDAPIPDSIFEVEESPPPIERAPNYEPPQPSFNAQTGLMTDGTQPTPAQRRDFQTAPVGATGPGGFQ